VPSKAPGKGGGFQKTTTDGILWSLKIEDEIRNMAVTGKKRGEVGGTWGGEEKGGKINFV